jgi:hypothetical protein
VNGDRRDLRTLPKAHLHLHFTGAMRHETLLELATRDGIRLPEQLVSEWPPALSAADEKGWFRFQRLYDVARSVLRTPEGGGQQLAATHSQNFSSWYAYIPGLKVVAPATPAYWAMQGLQAAMGGGGSPGDTLIPAAVLLGFAAVAITVVMIRFRVDEPKSGVA